jgi:hypothetical protein
MKPRARRAEWRFAELNETAVHCDTTMSQASRGLEETIARLERYCRTHQWAGFDPYDALNSQLFARTPLAKSRVARLAMTQILKRSPVNLRPLLRVAPQQEPKAIALFLTAYLKLAQHGDGASLSWATHLAQRLLELRSTERRYWCWGYSFPWQTRRELVPRFAPNLVCTSFAAHALLDAYESGLGSEFLAPAVSAGEYIANELYWHDGEQAGYAYPLPHIKRPVHNASLLGAALLCRLSRLTGNQRAIAGALRVTRYSAASQREDGSWPYGLAATQQWIDNFHTGYNLCALQSIGSSVGTDEFESVLRKGLDFYTRHFFTGDGVAKYFHDRTYPIDIHAIAQSVITLSSFPDPDGRNLALAGRVSSFAMTRMWDARGFFHYRLLRGLSIRTPYMRWSQAWILLALASLRTHLAWFGQPFIERQAANC